MKSVTLRADQNLIEKARSITLARGARAEQLAEKVE
jgi:hypothetical protein